MFLGIDGFGFMVVLAVWGIPLLLVSLILYVVIRFGVKHGMRSYHAEASRRAVPADSITGSSATGPTAVHPGDDIGADSFGDPAR
jgi:hypothetical protein